MNFKNLKALPVLGFILLAIISFTAGYFVGNRNHNSPMEFKAALSNDDMEHAFGKAGAMNNPSDPHESTAKSLGDLVAGLEKKVAANPNDIDQQLLLAQTYNELEQRDKSLELLKSLNKRAGNNAQVKIVYATVLMTSNNKSDLKLAYQLFDEAIKLKPDVASMAKMYMGEINVKLKQ